MRDRQHKNALRQAAWDALRSANTPIKDVKTLAEHTGATNLRPYILALKKRGYVQEIENGAIELVKNTGPTAPGYNVQTGAFRDWNLDPLMTGEQLRAAIAATGLKLRPWLISHGQKINSNSTTRLREMIRGKRPVSDTIERLAQNDLENAAGEEAGTD